MALTRRRLVRVAGIAGASALAGLGVPALAGARVNAAGGSPQEAMTPRRFASWNSARGMACAHSVTNEDIGAFAALGGNILRPSFATMPFMSKTPPYALDQRAFDRLDEIVDSCEQYGVAVVIDPHTFPGCRDDFTTFPDDELWNDYRFHDLAERFWSYTADRYRRRGPVIAGYDLLNEPAVVDVRADAGPASWNELALRLTAAIRGHDTEHHVIIASAISPKPQGSLWYSRFESVNELPPPPDEKIVISPHMYAPQAFTHQGVSDEFPLGPTYPGTVAGQDWEGLPPSVRFDQAALWDYLRPALTYANTYGVPIYVGEFSAARWTGDPGNRYLEDCLRFFQEHGWSWTYHSWREWHGWNAEMNNYDMDDQTQYDTTPRLALLKRYFSQSRRPAGRARQELSRR